MERFIKIAGIGIYMVVALCSNAWAIVLGFAFLVQLACFWKRGFYVLLFVPLAFTLMASVGGAYLWVFMGGFAIYLIRCFCGDDCFNESKLWMFFLLMLIGTLLYTPYIIIVPFVFLNITFPIYKGFKPLKSGHGILSFIIIFTIIIAFAYSGYGFGEGKQRAYLQKGVWAKSDIPYELDNLRNASCYSYSEFTILIKADTISQLQNLSKYNELWIITPTTPFTAKEITSLKEWVKKGGNLILVSDHTDLYGHARCVNQLANVFGCHINYSATFDRNDKQVFKNAFLQPSDVKTGTNMKGLAFPLLAAWMWEEDAYYANQNFFGPLAISGDDSYGNKLLIGQVAYGLGQVSFFQDSTVFSNFAVYQPFVMDVARLLSSHSVIARLFSLLPFLILLTSVASAYEKKRIMVLFALLMILCIPYYDSEKFNYGSNPQIWTGNPTFVQENGCPHTKISTIYSLSPLSKRKPLWISNVPSQIDDVIWVDSICPPNSNWRWIKVEDIHYIRQTTNNPMDSLYQILDAPYIESWEGVSHDFKRLDVNPIFNDRVMNDWWYNDGITKNRYARIHAWINWLNKSDEKVSTIIYEENEFTKERCKALVRIEDKNPIWMHLPKPTVPNGTEIYLGNGITGYVVQRGDTVSIFGKGQYCENFGGPGIWAIDYWDE